MDADSDDQPTVLIVDDERTVLETYELYLAEDYDVRTAENGEAALEAFGPGIDIVLLDRRMPGMSGDHVLERIRESEVDCRVAMVTAVDPGPEIVDLAFDEYLYKPIDRQQLIETVQQLLLFDKYERLLEEYHAATKTYGTLRSHADPDSEGAAEELSKLEDRQTALRTALRATVDQFTDEEIATAFREAHGAHDGE